MGNSTEEKEDKEERKKLGEKKNSRPIPINGCSNKHVGEEKEEDQRDEAALGD